jgi:hypothetical protein
MEIHDEYTGIVYYVSPEEEPLVERMTLAGATTPEIVEALSLPTPQPDPEKAHGYLPATDGGVIPIEEVPELHDEEVYTYPDRVDDSGLSEWEDDGGAA